MSSESAKTASRLMPDYPGVTCQLRGEERVQQAHVLRRIIRALQCIYGETRSLFSFHVEETEANSSLMMSAYHAWVSLARTVEENCKKVIGRLLEVDQLLVFGVVEEHVFAEEVEGRPLGREDPPVWL